MITYLKVRNLAIVEEFAIEPGAGLNVLTGETGAGKSLLIDSLEFLRGARGSTEMIRGGAEKMSAEAIFHLPKTISLEELGVDIDDSGELIVKREIATNGRGRVLMNGSPIAVRELGAAMDAVIEIHGQHESHQRVAGQSFRELVDEYAGHETLVDATRTAYREWTRASDELKTLTDAQRDRALRLDLLRYQVEEISQARLDPAEEEVLRGEKSILANAREMIEVTSGAFSLIDDDESSALAQLGRAAHLLQPLSREVAELRQIGEELQEVIYKLQDVARTLGNLSDSVRHDPARLDEVEDRLVTIERLKKKYGGSIEGVLEHLSRIQDEFERLSDFEANVEKLQLVEQSAYAAYRKAAEKLSASRKKSASAFQNAIQSELNDLAMERTTVRITIDSGAESTDGIDRIDILIAPNRGEEPKPMQRIASGGELSRIQLAIAAALFKASTRAAAATLVFDEIDAGIGGRTASSVGAHLQELARGRQILCITHLPQVAAVASKHFTIAKDASAVPARTSVETLQGNRIVNELVRMLGATDGDRAASQHARQLLAQAA